MKKRKIQSVLVAPAMIVLMLLLATGELAAMENGLARTPPMGWNSWNIFGGNINETLIKEIADAMVSSGMRDAGYIYLNLDDMWMDDKGRDSSGNLIGDLDRFPGGIKALADYCHDRGLKLGLYGDRGTATCCNVPESGSQGYETRDANTFASWGIDYLKYDSCNASQDMQTNYTAMSNALASSGRPIVFSICAWYFAGDWMMDVGNLWRTTGDITDNFNSFLGIINTNEPLYPKAGPGHWNDPDMLEVGNGGCTYEEYKSHFSIWCMMAAPLIAGNDIRSMSAETTSILCNSELIAIDQDPAGIQGHIVSDQGDLEVWVKPLGSANGTDKAVALFNRSASTATITALWGDIGLSGSASVRDLWVHSDLGSFNASYSASVQAHGVKVLRITTVGTSTTPPTSAPTSAPTTPPNATPTGTLGDANGSGSIDIVDALVIAQHYVGLNPSNFISANADVNCDGSIDIVDALLISQYYVGLIGSFC
ncbi:MAG: alpha-galactosidase [Spirochaetales bacterium]|nr:alpha-galactosidase [Spirochaetales bacterium]